jgi:hypothetical protein
MSWFLNDERLYLDHLLQNHGKKMFARSDRLDSIKVLTNWLDTCDQRRWDFTGVEALKLHAVKNLNELMSRIINRG